MINTAVLINILFNWLVTVIMLKPMNNEQARGRRSTFYNLTCESLSAVIAVIDVGRTSLTRVDGWFISDTVEGLVFIYK